MQTHTHIVQYKSNYKWIKYTFTHITVCYPVLTFSLNLYFAFIQRERGRKTKDDFRQGMEFVAKYFVAYAKLCYLDLFIFIYFVAYFPTLVYSQSPK